MALNELFPQTSGSPVAREEHWIPLSDLMTGLMMMFMLVAIIFMVQVDEDAKKAQHAAQQAETLANINKDTARKAEIEADKIRQVAHVYDLMKAQLYEDLRAEFEDALNSWGADLDRDLTIRFREPDVLFNSGEDILKERFRRILEDFFPRYISILTSDKYKDSIEEIRIEGHTSSVWKGQTTDDAYFSNMELSQSRTRTTLKYVLNLPKLDEHRAWLRSHLTANGLSSSRLRYNSDGTENRIGSQRVEFRVRTNADARISAILQAEAQ
ncbi:OmpA/MotB family protein [Microvirga tunisiensis]|uniref:OmpA family protein n=1 Tax=Microvirga tunisiensis TaxID=2108360 RepID=A0A5N7MRP0_9HYPH|nr:OmpA family protein [Microvirga tunisiensis]MPR11657.1 OmpA family protein [Microvirga tunisiensis]MPR29661.1 OmpA family protein [Microvirga tunisiensis]